MALSTALLGALTLTGCHTDMWVQPKVKPQADSDFFPDNQSSRPRVPNAVPRGLLKTDQEYHTGWTGGTLVNGKLQNAQLVDKIPTAALQAFDGDQEKMLKRGQERFNIFCSPCHSKLGDGDGFIARRGFSQARPPVSYHTDRLRNMPIGHYFDVITEGYGVMYSYASRVETQDRWAIAAYIRVLQLSQNANLADLTPEEIQKAEAKNQPLAPPDPSSTAHSSESTHSNTPNSSGGNNAPGGSH